MFERGNFWPAQPDWTSASIARDGLAISVQPQGRAVYLLSGKAAAVTGFAKTLRNAPGASLLRLAADRFLLLSSTDPGLEEGWHKGGFAVSAMGHAYVCFELRGPKASALLSAGSPSFAMASGQPLQAAALVFAGVTAFVEGFAEGFRLHVEHPQAGHVWHWLLAATSQEEYQVP